MRIEWSLNLEVDMRIALVLVWLLRLRRADHGLADAAQIVVHGDAAGPGAAGQLRVVHHSVVVHAVHASDLLHERNAGSNVRVAGTALQTETIDAVAEGSLQQWKKREQKEAATRSAGCIGALRSSAPVLRASLSCPVRL